MAQTKDKTEKYILKPGQEHHGFKGDVRHTYSGDDPENNVVELTETQFAQFKDKFITEAAARDLQKKASELQELQAEQAKLKAALDARGISIEDLLGEQTVKKPDAGVKATENEPTQKGNIPAPTGSTSDPVNTPPKTGQK